MSLFSIIGLSRQDSFSIDLLLSNFDNNDYFFDRYIPDAGLWVYDMFWLKDEEHIRNMGCLEWKIADYYEYDYSTFQLQVEWYELVSTFNATSYYTSPSPSKNIGSAQTKQAIENAIEQQLANFYYMKSRLEETRGLFYFATDGNRQIGNIPDDDVVSFCRSQAVYRIAEPGKEIEQSRTGNNRYVYSDYYYSGYYKNNLSIYIAFTDVAVARQVGGWRAAQRQIETQLIIILLPAALVLVLIIILMLGAGRKHGGENGKVYFIAVDKPWLDLGLCLLFCYELFLCYFASEMISVAMRYDSSRWILVLCAMLSVFFTIPLLWWVLSFIKRCKAGNFWRHTFVYVLIHRTFSTLRRHANSLWSGFSLTLRIVFIGCVVLATVVISVITRPSWAALIFAALITAVTVYGLLRFSRKLYLVEQGAKAASTGRYDNPIAVTGGELGNIAASINSMTDGINAAIMERLKSERLKTELITNISHDIRTPLTSLITYTDLLKSEGFDSERAPEYLEILIQKSARLKTLTDDLFEASKAASGNIDVHMENLDLVDLVRQVLGELDEKVRGSGLDFRLSLPENAPVYADGRLLWRVMENLLSNVFKYTLAGSRVYVDVMPDDKWYRLDIKNISEHPLNIEPSELLERFKRGDEARTGDGSGLGLSIAQSFMLSQGGKFALSIDGDLFKASIHLSKS